MDYYFITLIKINQKSLLFGRARNIQNIQIRMSVILIAHEVLTKKKTNRNPSSCLSSK